ncbi:MAG: hypothetical protein H0T62_08040 [Parachlamydiaceae bacterium]|nr:hypothetical protein [Parachlamydiaceae bacterium]
MNNFLSLLFCCLLGFSGVNADESSETSNIFTNENQVSIDDPSQYSAQMRNLANIADKNEESVMSYFHRIKEVDIEDKAVFLEDGSKWDIGYWHTDAIANWEVGDRLAVSFSNSFNGMGLQNLDKGSLAWASIWGFNMPQAENSDSVISLSNDDPNYSAIVTLKSGFEFGIPTYWFGDPTFKIGDPVFVFQKGDIYSVANLNTGKVAKSSTLITVGNPDWRHEAQ